MLSTVGLQTPLFHVGTVSSQGDFDAWPVGGSTTLSAGSNSTGDIFVQGSGGFDASVTFTATVSPSISNSPLITFNPATFGVSGLGSSDTFMTISTRADTPAQVYSYTITASGGGVTHSWSGTIMILPFSLSTLSASLEVLQTYPKSVGITITSIGKFAGTLSLTTHASPSELPISLSSTILFLQAGQRAGVTVTFSPSSQTPTGPYSASLNVSTGKVWQIVSFSVYVAGFTVSANPGSLVVLEGGSSTSTIEVDGQGMFYGVNVMLSANVLGTRVPGLSAIVNPNYVHLNSPPVGLTTLTVSASTVPPGTYTATVTGIYSSISHSVNVTVRVVSLVSMIKRPDNAIYWSGGISAGTDWQRVPGGTLSTPSLCPTTSGRIDTVVRGTDNGIYHSSFADGVWSGSWDSPGGSTLDRPSCAILNGNLYVAVRGTDNAAWVTSLNIATSEWSSWTGLGGTIDSAPVLVSSPSLNRLDLVVKGVSDSIWYKSFVNGAWSTRWDTPGGTSPNPAAVVSDGQSLQVVVRGTDDGIWYNKLSLATGSWSGWSALGGATSSTPVLTFDPSGTLHPVVVGTDGGIWHMTKASGGQWSGWDSAGGTTWNAPTVAALPSGLVVLVRGTDGNVWSDSLSASAWTGWQGLGITTSDSPSMSEA
ncbi:MAG TPA: hypothetical protein VNA15_07480 [Candidatus Angelobacter sp.]|nr:hypothetical protein [Candidatus Angelobacter sp.]